MSRAKPGGPREYKTYDGLSLASKRDRMTQLNRIKRYWTEGEVSDYVPPDCWPAVVMTEDNKAVKARASDKNAGNMIPLGDAREWPSNLLRRLVDVAHLTVNDPAEASEYMARTVRNRHSAFEGVHGETDYGLTGQDCGKICIMLGDVRDREAADKARAAGGVNPRHIMSSLVQDFEADNVSPCGGSNGGHWNNTTGMETPATGKAPRSAASKRKAKCGPSPSTRPNKRRDQRTIQMEQTDPPPAAEPMSETSRTDGIQPSTPVRRSSSPASAVAPVRLPSISMMLSEQQPYTTGSEERLPMALDRSEDAETEDVATGRMYAVMKLDQQVEDLRTRQTILATKERLLKLQRAHMLKQYK